MVNMHVSMFVPGSLGRRRMAVGKGVLTSTATREPEPQRPIVAVGPVSFGAGRRFENRWVSPGFPVLII